MTMRTCESTIRHALHQRLAPQLQDEPDALLLDELGLHRGQTRVDVAILGHELHGFEIKSDRDTLYRIIVSIRK